MSARFSIFPEARNGEGQKAKSPAKDKKSKKLSDEELEVLNKRWESLLIALNERNADPELLDMAEHFAAAAFSSSHVRTRAIKTLSHDEVNEAFPYEDDLMYSWEPQYLDGISLMPLGLGMLFVPPSA